MTRLHAGTVNGLSLAVGVASLTIGLVSLVTTHRLATANAESRPRDVAAIVVSGDHREHPGRALRIRFVAPPNGSDPCCRVSQTAATIRD